MAVDIGDLIDAIQAEVNPPGENLFPNATDDDWFNSLVSGFWGARMDGLLSNYTINAQDQIVPIAGTTDISRDLQQIIVLYASMTIIVNQLRAMNTTFRAVAGPVQFETQKSAQVLRGILDDIKARRGLILTRLSDIGAIDSYYIDALIERENSVNFGETYFLR